MLDSYISCLTDTGNNYLDNKMVDLSKSIKKAMSPLERHLKSQNATNEVLDLVVENLEAFEQIWESTRT
jgi:hypothetical protein